MIGIYFIIIVVLIGLAFIGLGISTFFSKKPISGKTKP